MDRSIARRLGRLGFARGAQACTMPAKTNIKGTRDRSVVDLEIGLVICCLCRWKRVDGRRQAQELFFVMGGLLPAPRASEICRFAWLGDARARALRYVP
jgi:hypothetical protein